MSLNLFGKNTPDRGLYGNLSLSYYDDSIKTRYKYSIEDFTREFKLGYMGNIYSPKLLDYKIDTLLKYQDITNKNQSTENTLEAKTFDYSMNLNFLKESKFPLTIYKNQSDSPYTHLEEASSSQFLYRSDNEGLNGSIRFDDLSINYTIAKNNLETEEQNYANKALLEQYSTSLSYNKKNYNFNVNYQQLNRDTETVYFDKSAEDINSTQVDNTLNMSFQANINDDIRLSSSFSQFSSEYLQYKNDTSYADLGLSFKPQKRYSGGIYLSASTLASQYEIEENNTTTLIDDTFDTFNINQNFNYKITDNLNLSQVLSEYIYDSNKNKGSMTNLRLGANHHYANMFKENYYFTMRSNVNYQKLYNNIEDKIQKTNNNNNIDIFTLNLTPNLRTNFAQINSTSLLGAEYFDTRYSNGEYTQRYALSLNLNSKFLYIVGNNFTSNIYKTNNRIKWERRIPDGDEDLSNDIYETAINSGSTTSTKIQDKLDFSFRLLNKGSIGFITGLEYSNTSSTNNRVEMGKILADMLLQYRFKRGLHLTSNVHIDKDVVNDVLTNNGKILLSYMVGKTQITAGYKYYNSSAPAGSGFQAWSRNRFDAKLTRRF